MKQIAVLATFILVSASQAIFCEVPVDPPGTYSTSWLGNTYMDMKGKQNVTESLDDVCVSPNGRVFSAGYAETWGGGASYHASDGGFIARYDRFESGFGDPVKSVAADDHYVYYGTPGKGILRAPHGGAQGGYTPFLSGKDIQGFTTVRLFDLENVVTILIPSSCKKKWL